MLEVDWFVLVLMLGAATRLTRLVMFDDAGWLIRQPLYWLRLGRVLDCVWCFGFWIAIIVVGSFYAVGGSLWWTVPAVVLTISAVVGFMGDMLTSDADD